MAVLIVSGPSGTGKSTLISHFIMQQQGTWILPPSITTKANDGTNDHVFVTEHEFDLMLSNNEFLETTTFAMYRYGTSRHILKQSESTNLVLTLTPDGMQKAAREFPDAYTVFLYADPPVLYRRISERGRGESLEEICKRLETACCEIRYAGQYDLVLNNGSASRMEDLVVRVQELVENRKPPSDELDISRFCAEAKELLSRIRLGRA